MNSLQRDICRKLRALSSKEAADWIIGRYRLDKGTAEEAYIIMPHRSWAEDDQRRLAEYYLSNIPHSSNLGYRAFLKIMSLPTFINSVKKNLPSDGDEMRLIRYYLIPLLNSHPHNSRYNKIVNGLIESIL